ncbi:hypothetical protein JTB14_037973 [Gonioctena quinquepunctata]|nr:hypothetical protein JTB14_037973 [Gonioctena quinquepunctata]
MIRKIKDHLGKSCADNKKFCHIRRQHCISWVLPSLCDRRFVINKDSTDSGSVNSELSVTRLKLKDAWYMIANHPDSRNL